MSTTVLIVEHVISGIQSAVVLSIIAMGVLGVPASIPSLPENLALPLSLLILAFFYPLGTLIDELADWIFHRSESSIRRASLVALGLPPETRLMTLLTEKSSPWLESYFGYMRMRIRIARCTALNMTLLLGAILFCIAMQKDAHLPKHFFEIAFFAGTLTVAIGALSIWNWRVQVKNFCKRRAEIAASRRPTNALGSESTTDVVSAEPRYWPRLAAATELAIQSHAMQRRKGSNVPYLTHLYGVTGFVLQFGGDDTTAAAAMLHDAAEDQGGKEMLEQISVKLGPETAELVRQCSDTLVMPKPPWRERKQRAIDAIAEADERTCLIKAADVLHNAESVLEALGDGVQDHDEFWSQFRGGRDGTLWYFSEMTRVLEPRVPQPLIKRIQHAIARFS